MSLEHGRRFAHAERRSRLVEDQHARAEMKGARNRQRLPLAARQGADELARIDARG